MAEYRLTPVDHDPFAEHLATLSGIGEALTPEWAKPFAGMSAEQANREAQILASGKQAPGKIGPGYLSDTQRLGSAAGDIFSLLAPEGAALGMAMPAKISPEMAARLMEMIKSGMGRQAAADALGVGKATVNRALAKEGITTAQPSFWDRNAEALARLKEMASQGHSQAKIAEELGTTPGNVYQKLTTMKNAGEFDYEAPERRVWTLPETQAKIKDLAAQGYSQSEIASVIKGGPSGKMQTDRAQVSKALAGMREAGEIPDYAPQGGTRTPSMPQLKSLEGEAPQADPEWEKLQRQYLKGLGYAGISGIMLTPVDHDPFATQ